MTDLKNTRQSRGLNQTEVEKLSGISVPRQSKFENGMIPTMREALKLEAALGCKIKWPDPLPKDEKEGLISRIKELSEQYPLSAVMRYVNRIVQEETINHQTVTS